MRILLALFVLAAGCSTADPRPVVDDVVCLYNGDLGCVKVRVDEATPRSEYRGKTYYFCCPRCKVLFDQDPEKYASGR